MKQIFPGTITAHYQPANRGQYETLGDLQLLRKNCAEQAKNTVIAARTKAAQLLWDARATVRTTKDAQLLVLEKQAAITLDKNAHTLAATMLQQSAELACGLAEKILGHVLQYDKSFITKEVQKALRTLPSTASTVLSASSADIQELQSAISPQRETRFATNPSPGIRSDETLDAGEARIRTESFELHISWKHCFEKLKEKIFAKFVAQEKQVAFHLTQKIPAKEHEYRRAA